MLFKRVSRSAAEQIFIVVKNASGGTITAGYSCAWELTSPDGVSVTQPAAPFLQAFAGIADADIANGAYGLLQVYGYRSSAYISRSNVAASAAGVECELLTGNWGLSPVGGAVSGGQYKCFAFLCEAVTSSASASYTTAKVFIRAL